MTEQNQQINPANVAADIETTKGKRWNLVLLLVAFFLGALAVYALCGAVGELVYGGALLSVMLKGATGGA